MKLSILCIGRVRDGAEQRIVGRYLERLEKLGGQFGIRPVELIEFSEGVGRSGSERQSAEASAIKGRTADMDCMIALDERGREFSSREFSDRLMQFRDNGARHLCFIVGGPDGLAPDLRREAELVVSFGRMTMPHGLVRCVLLEQLYRAVTIMAGHPYHRD